MKRRKRKALILVGVDRGKIATVDKINHRDESCRVTFFRRCAACKKAQAQAQSGLFASCENCTKRQYHVMLDAVDFGADEPREGMEFGGHTDEEAAILNSIAGD